MVANPVFFWVITNYLLQSYAGVVLLQVSARQRALLKKNWIRTMANSNSKLKTVSDHVMVDGETFIIVSVNGNRALLTFPNGTKRFTLSTSELAGKEVFIEGLHSEQQAAGGELSLEDELKPIIGRLPIQGWFNSIGGHDLQGAR